MLKTLTAAAAASMITTSAYAAIAAIGLVQNGEVVQSTPMRIVPMTCYEYIEQNNRLLPQEEGFPSEFQFDPTAELPGGLMRFVYFFDRNNAIVILCREDDLA